MPKYFFENAEKIVAKMHQWTAMACSNCSLLGDASWIKYHKFWRSILFWFSSSSDSFGWWLCYGCVWAVWYNPSMYYITWPFAKRIVNYPFSCPFRLPDKKLFVCTRYIVYSGHTGTAWNHIHYIHDFYFIFFPSCLAFFVLFPRFSVAYSSLSIFAHVKLSNE